MVENFDLYEIGKNAYVIFTSPQGEITIRINKHPYLFTQRNAHLLDELFKEITEYEKEMFE